MTNVIDMLAWLHQTAEPGRVPPASLHNGKALTMTTFRVHYMKPEHFRDFILGQRAPEIATLSDTHVYLMDVEASEIEDVFLHCQGEVWSPNGEARSLILSKGLAHTSMSVGDVVEEDGRFWHVCPVGFRLLHDR